MRRGSWGADAAVRAAFARLDQQLLEANDDYQAVIVERAATERVELDEESLWADELAERAESTRARTMPDPFSDPAHECVVCGAPVSHLGDLCPSCWDREEADRRDCA